MTALCEEPFLLLEKGEKAEISAIFDRCGLTPQVRFTTWDDYAVMSMVESGLGISVLPELILKRVPYRIVTRELSIPAFRNIGFAMRDKRRRRSPCAGLWNICNTDNRPESRFLPAFGKAKTAAESGLNTASRSHHPYKENNKFARANVDNAAVVY